MSARKAVPATPAPGVKYPKTNSGNTGMGAPSAARKLQASRLAEHRSRSASAS